MADQLQPNNQQPSDEIDLGQLLQLIKRGFHSLGNFVLRLFLYLKRNGFKLVGLVVLGLAISFGLAQIVTKKLKTDVIVHPNFESKNYLYDAVAEVSMNLKARNEDFINELQIDNEDLKGFTISIEPIKDEEVKTDDSILNEMKYLDILKNFKDESFVLDIIRSEISKKSVLNHKITFAYKDAQTGSGLANKLIDYLNTNEYFNAIKVVSDENSKSRIVQNEKLIQQIDQLIENYSKALLSEKKESTSEVVYLERENTLNVHSVLTLKQELLKEIESKKLDITRQKGVLSILNFGKTQQVKKTFFNQTYFLIPSLLVVAFLMLGFLKYLERRSKEIQ